MTHTHPLLLWDLDTSGIFIIESVDSISRDEGCSYVCLYCMKNLI